MGNPIKHRHFAALTAVAAGAALLATTGAAHAATLPVKDGKIVFARANQIYTINPAGTGLKQLTTTATGRSYQPRWSPDGKKLAFVNEPTAGQRFLDVMNADGTGRVQLTAKTVGPGGAAWSPDGTTLAFGGPNNNKTIVGDVGPYYLDHIKATAHNGTPATYAGNLPNFGTINVSDVIGPVAWSRSGLISYDSANYASDQGSDAFLLTYSPASKNIAMVQQSGGDASGYFAHPTFSPSNAEAYEQAVTIVGDPTEPPTIIGPKFPQVAHDRTPDYSPTGTRFVFVNDKSGTEVYTASVNGSGRKLLTAGYSPDWQATS